MSAAQFDAVSDDYVAGVADALNKSESQVNITSVEEVVTRRRLLGVSVLVDTSVTVNAEEAESVASSVTPENLNSALSSRNMTVVEVTDVAVSTAKPTTASEPTPEPATTPTRACPDG
jgi:hypothetical protein